MATTDPGYVDRIVNGDQPGRGELAFRVAEDMCKTVLAFLAGDLDIGLHLALRNLDAATDIYAALTSDTRPGFPAPRPE